MLSSWFECGLLTTGNLGHYQQKILKCKTSGVSSLGAKLWEKYYANIMYIQALFCLKSVFHCHLFNTSGTLCAAALCPPASTSASGPVVLLHLTVSEAETLQSGGTHHSTGLALTQGQYFYKTYSKYTFNYFDVYHPLAFCRHSQKMWFETRFCYKLPPFFDNRKSIYKIHLLLQSCLNRTN